MIDEFTIGIILMLIFFGSIFLFLIFLLTAPAFGDDGEDPMVYCYRHQFPYTIYCEQQREDMLIEYCIVYQLNTTTCNDIYGMIPK